MTKQLSGEEKWWLAEATVTPQVSGIIDLLAVSRRRICETKSALYQINSDNYTNVLAGSRATLEQNIASINTAKPIITMRWQF